GRRTARRWLEEMLAEPRQEYPEFPAALSHVLMLEPAELTEVLERRAQRLSAALATLDANAAAEAGHGLPRIAMLETEYQRAVRAGGARVVTQIRVGPRGGGLTWARPAFRAWAGGRGAWGGPCGTGGGPGRGDRRPGCRPPPCPPSTARAGAPATTPARCTAP